MHPLFPLLAYKHSSSIKGVHAVEKKEVGGFQMFSFLSVMVYNIGMVNMLLFNQQWLMTMEELQMVKNDKKLLLA